MKKYLVSLLLFSLLPNLGFPRSNKRMIAQAVEKSIEDKLITAPKDQETCFSPDERCDSKLIEFIKSAEKSIDLAIYDINLDQLVHQLAMKSKKIPVRVVVDKRQSKGPHSLVSTLIKT